MLINRITPSHYPITVNNIRQYSNSASTIVKNTITYNDGLPWWASIVLTAVITRTMIHLPLTILDHHTRAKRENLKDELMEVAKRIKMELQMQAATTEMTPSRARFIFTLFMTKEQKELYERENCHPLKSLVITLIQAPIWVSFSVAMRNMCYMLPQINNATILDCKELSYGGFGWIENLIDMDHYLVLPILLGLSSLAIIEINKISYNVPRSKFTIIFTNFCRVLIVVLVPVTAFIPTGLSLFWVTNNCYILLQNLLLLSPKIRRLARIPKTDIEIQQPYTALYNQVLGKAYSMKSVARGQN
ncbi:unnamed protein product [Xylocopa violacea]|uniref:Membrane insertase YidC/Oxa/ALB C-terminal domain-containing protein n=1 Tax=Xylocopa violacea TaxID=135666 RepID=A0ABP1MZ32_XYLVO